MIRAKIKRLLKASLNDKTRGNIIGKILLQVYRVFQKIDRFFYKRKNKTISRGYIRLKNIERRLFTKNEFATFEDLVNWTNDWIKTFPETYDIIVGIPRAGLLVANIIAGKLGKPLSTPEFFKDGQYWVGGSVESTGLEKKERYNILLVDDCIRQEIKIKKPERILRSSNKVAKITRAVLLVSEEAARFVDLYYKVLRGYPPVAEWNLLHRKRGILAVDMDGVICEECPSHVDLNDKLYNDWLRNARPYLVPTFKIDYIVSSRLEKYRPETEEWLDRHGVRYKKLILWDLPSKDSRDDKFAQHKIDVLLQIKPSAYWESSYDQAEAIWKATRIPTICIDEMVVFGTLGST